MGLVRIAGTLAESRVNGPGRRAVVHFQGCTLGCGGCFNPETHPSTGGSIVDVEWLAAELAVTASDGVSISGGEPFQQPEALLALVRSLRAKGVASILIFSGFELTEITGISGSESILDTIDVLVAGRYVAAQHTEGQLTASDNQRVHFLSDVYGPEDILTGQGGVEITILPDGRVVMTGFPPPALRRAVRALGG